MKTIALGIAVAMVGISLIAKIIWLNKNVYPRTSSHRDDLIDVVVDAIALPIFIIGILS